VSLGVKAVLGLVWGVVAYLIRIYANVLIEPQINPIKHFPVVTVSHKIILPLSLTLTSIIAAPLEPLIGTVIASFIAGTTVLLLPGVFGFLVWELKENWRLYEANRPRTLGRVAVGEHGETVTRLLRPGLHSGTLPKLFAKLRKSERRWLADGREKALLKHQETLHHVEDSIRRFVAREFLELVRESGTLGPLEIEAGDLAVSTNRIRIELRTRDNAEGMWIMFEERAGRLIAEVTDPGWLPAISDRHRRALAPAVVGLYLLSGIEWLRSGAGAGHHHEPSHEGDLDPGDRLTTFVHVSVTWKRWVECWERDLRGDGPLPGFTVALHVLPNIQGGDENRRPTPRRTDVQLDA
jgi:hypothetical protein